jgi:flagellar biosynthesis anti-sigma factor FlgM
VEISSRKQEVDRLTEKAKAQSVVREDRVEELKAKIEDGTYNARGQIVAGSILKSNILDELL